MSNRKIVKDSFGYQDFNRLLEMYHSTTDPATPAAGNEIYLCTATAGVGLKRWSGTQWDYITIPTHTANNVWIVKTGWYINQTGTALKGLTFNASDEAVFSEAVTVTKLLTATKGIVSGYTGTINDDTAKSFVIPLYCTITIISQSTAASTRSAIIINAGANGLYAGTYLGSDCNIVAGVGVLTGMDGTDGKLNFRANSTTLYIENRLGGTSPTISITIAG